MLEEMARQLSTNHKTHLENNLFIFAKRYLKYLTRTNEVVDTAPIEQLGTKAAYNKVVSAIEHAFWKHLTEKNGSDLTIEAVISGRPKTLEALPETHAVWPVAQLLLDHMKEFVPRGTTLSDKSKIMFDMMRKLEPFAEALQRQFQEGGTRPPGPFRGKSKIRFCLVPQADWRPKHILISSTALGILLTQLSRNDPDLKRIREALEHAGVLAKGASDEDKYKLWDALFDMRRVLRKKHLNDPSQLRFGNFIATDGVSVSACMMTKKSPLQCKAIELKDAIEQAEESGDEKVLEEGKAEWKKVDQEIKARNDGYRITERVQQLVAPKRMEDGTIETKARIVGLDPGKKSAATWVVHEPEKQAKHQKWKGDQGEKTLIDERYESGSLGSGQWRFMSGQKQYTAKMNRRMDKVCQEWRKLPSTKTINLDHLLEAYRQQVALWPRIKDAFFDDTRWYQKTKMRKYCKTQKAMEDVIAMITGTRNKEEQKKVVVAYGDGDNQGTLRGTSPIMSSKLLRKVRQNACVVLTNEHLTSLLCSCCHHKMKQFRGQFRMKRCVNSDCIRTVWDRDINASINILYLFLFACLSGDAKVRPEAFQRKIQRKKRGKQVQAQGCDE